MGPVGLRHSEKMGQFRVSSTSSKQSKTIKDLVLPTQIPSFLLLLLVRFLPSLPLKESSCHLDILQVVATALRLCEGAYGVAFIFEDISKILKVQVWNLSCWLKVPQNHFLKKRPNARRHGVIQLIQKEDKQQQSLLLTIFGLKKWYRHH